MAMFIAAQNWKMASVIRNIILPFNREYFMQPNDVNCRPVCFFLYTLRFFRRADSIGFIIKIKKKVVETLQNHRQTIVCQA